MKLFALFLFLMTLSIVANGQNEVSKTNLGVGIGLDYGGFGGRFTFLPDQHFGLFVAAGYNLDGLGYNVGAQYRILPDKRAVPVIGFMYGYNAVIHSTDLFTGTTKRTTYYGPSLSGGVEFHSKTKPNFFNLELLIPFRSKELNGSGLFPFTVSIGYHFGL